MLYLVPTPIGNLEDMTYRSVRVLNEVDMILAEDTRTSRKLLDHYGITTQMQAFHAHNEHKVLTYWIQQLNAGVQVALISDAGTPGISDPGFLLARACKEANIEVTCLPGATAFVPALVASGIPCDTFHYEGFLPHKKGRQTRLIALSEMTHTFVIYESPHRLDRCLKELAAHCGEDRIAAVARELSKKFEEVRRDTLANLGVYYLQHPAKGEIAIVVAGR